MIKRIVVVCIYNSDGMISESDVYLVKELRANMDYVLVVINGDARNAFLIEEYADEVVFRNNRGYDAFAYKQIVLGGISQCSLNEYDELYLCNNSFFGPIVPLNRIIAEMSKRKSDFWGISSFEKNLVLHIQSYFLCYKRKVFSSTSFIDYFRDNICDEADSYDEICRSFENGLFNCLIFNGYEYDAFSKNIMYDPYINPLGSIIKDGVPILKKKFFLHGNYNEEEANKVLNYITNQTNYPSEIIYKYVEKNYDVSIPRLAGGNYLNVLENKYYDFGYGISREDVNLFINRYKKIYIYGCGFHAKHIFGSFFYYKNNEKLIGFVVTDGKKIEDNYLGYSVFEYKDVPREAAIIIALNKDNTHEVVDYINGRNNILKLWGDNVK